MICFVVALKSEAEYILSEIKNLNEFKLKDKTAYSGQLDNRDIVLAISGIGKVSAALTTQLLIDKYSPEFIFNFGSCGGNDDNVEILNYYAIDKCVQFDFDITEIDDVPLGYIQEYNTVFFKTNSSVLDFLPIASLATADRFSTAQKDIDTIISLGCSVRDMEGSAIAQVCTSNNIPLIMIKGITDIQGHGTAKEQFFSNLNTVGKGFKNVILRALKNL